MERARKTVYFLRKSKMADRRFEVFRRALLGRGFFAHVAPLRSRPGVASVIWESLVSVRRCSREHFADNRSAQSFFIYIPPHSASYNIAATTTSASRVSVLVGHRKRAPPVQVTVATTTCVSRVSALAGHGKRTPVQVTVATTTCASRISALVGN